MAYHKHKLKWNPKQKWYECEYCPCKFSSTFVIPVNSVDKVKETMELIGEFPVNDPASTRS